MKPVVFISTELEIGGAENALTEIALRMPPMGYMPTVVSLRARPREGRDALVVRLEKEHLAVRFLDLKRPTQFFRGVADLRRVFEQNGATIALSFLFHANVVTAFAASSRKTVRHFAGIRVAEPSTWRNRLEAWALSRCAGVICVSEGVKQNFSRYFRDANRLCVIPNGVKRYVDYAPTDLSTIGIAEGAPVLLFMGRLHPQKGLDWALPHVGKVLERLEHLHFVIVGEGSHEDEDLLERLALGKSWSERVHFLGFQNGVGGFFKRASCLFLPSRWEGMPNVVLSAMSAGIPVIASSETGAREILGAESEVQTFAFGNGSELIEKLMQILNCEELTKRISAANLEASANFSWDKVAAEYARRFSERA
jgi:glycosyltransferase involved in cell wall biosynthesis